jgi:tRNA(Ile)-lysidine synthase
MIQIVESFIKSHNLLSQNQKVVIGVSGGPDSMALLHFLWTHKEQFEIQLIVAHVDHMFRGKESEEDARFVEGYCQTKRIVYEGTSINVNQHKNETGKSPQVAARDCRYQFYKEVMEKHQANRLALGHHGDDQIETMLMRLVNGIVDTGSLGMQAKRPFTTGMLVRPFLGITKYQIEQYCNEMSIPYRIDPSNEKDNYTRNRFRSSILPFLKKENQGVHIRFQQFNEYLKEDATFLTKLAKEHLSDLATFDKKSKCLFDKKKFLSISRPLQRRVIHLILNYLYQGDPIRIGKIHIEDCINLIESKEASGEIHLPKKLRLVKAYDDCFFTTEPIHAKSPYEITLNPPCVIDTPVGTIKSETKKVLPKDKMGKNTFICDLENVKFPLYIRSRKKGDRVSLKGKNGSKKIKDIFIDEKIPHFDRDKWPIITDGEGNIIWVPGIRHTKFSQVKETAREWLYLSFHKYEV